MVGHRCDARLGEILHEPQLAALGLGARLAEPLVHVLLPAVEVLHRPDPVELGAQLVSYAGWQLPLAYAGIRDEVLAVRHGQLAEPHRPLRTGPAHQGRQGERQRGVATGEAAADGL